MELEEEYEPVSEEAMEGYGPRGGSDGRGVGWRGVLAAPHTLPQARVTFLFSRVFLFGGWGPYYDRLGRSGARETDMQKPTTVASAAAEPLQWPFGPHVSGIAGTRLHIHLIYSSIAEVSGHPISLTLGLALIIHPLLAPNRGLGVSFVRLLSQLTST